jgi:Tol biopolymer transport system component
MRNRGARALAPVLGLVLLLGVPAGGLAAKKPPKPKPHAKVKPKPKPKPTPAPPGPTAKRNGKIAFVSDADGTRQIYLVNADGSEREQLTTSSVDLFQESFGPAWSPNGKLIAYGHADETGASGVWVMRADGSDQHALIEDGFAPAWSPDGTTIAFVRTNEDTGNDELWLASASGKDAKKLCGSADAGFESPAWTADGKQILYSRDGELVSAAPGAAVNCTAADLGSGDDPNAAWNGAIVFDRLGDSGNRALFVKPKSGDVQSLTGEESDNYEAVWSPDGKKLVFVTDRDGNAEIYVANADASGAVNITNDPPESDPDAETLTGPAQDGEPAWQPLL